MRPHKVIAFMLIVLLVGNITFFALGRLSAAMFWIVIVFCAIMAYFGIPYLRGRSERIATSRISKRRDRKT